MPKELTQYQEQILKKLKQMQEQMPKYKWFNHERLFECNNGCNKGRHYLNKAFILMTLWELEKLCKIYTKKDWYMGKLYFLVRLSSTQSKQRG